MIALFGVPSLKVRYGKDPVGWAADLDFDNDFIKHFMNAVAGFTANPQLNGSNSITWPNGGNIPGSAYGTRFVMQTSNNLVNWTDVSLGQLTTHTDARADRSPTPSPATPRALCARWSRHESCLPGSHPTG